MIDPRLKPDPRMRWTPFARMAAGALVLGYALALALFSHKGFPTGLSTGSWFPFLSDQPVGEDGYYLMMAAWRLGAGEGLTANFGETITGVQPLMTLLLAGVAAIIQAFGGDKFDLARAVIVLGGVNILLLAKVVADLAREAAGEGGDAEAARTFAFVSLCASFYVFRIATYGLETGLYLLLIALTLRASHRALARGRSFTTQGAIWIGALTGLTGLARIDFGVVAAIAFALMLLQRRIDLWRAAMAGLVALAIVAPWFLWVHAVSGAYMPTSGPAQSALVDGASAPGRAEAMVAAVLQNLAPWLPMSGDLRTGFAGLAVLVLLFALARGRLVPASLTGWLTGLSSLPFVYFVFFWAGHFYARYTAPLLALATVAAGCAAARLPARMRSPALGLFCVAAVVWNAAVLFRAHHAGGIGDGHAVTAGYVAREIPKEARVGAFQSGVTGYYNENVINLDGKVNKAALVAMREKKVEEYLDAARIEYVLDWQGVIGGLMPRAMASGHWRRCPKPVGNLETVCVMRTKPAAP